MAKTVNVEDTEPLEGNVTLVELSETPGPLGETVALSRTVPVNPLRLVMVTIADPDALWARLSMVGFDVALKSGVPFVLDWTIILPTMCCKCIEQ